MSSFVLDCSVTLAWCFEDESSDYAIQALDRLQETQAIVPSIWPLEVVNVLLVGERKGRLTEAETARFISLLGSLPIMVDQSGPERILGEVLSLAREQDLSSYDAAYLELAMRQALPIATLDEALRNAAGRVGVSLLDS